MMKLHDVCVVGLGGMGSSALYHCSKNKRGRGEKLEIIGIEQFQHVAHDQGSSHGDSRIIRLQYFEGSEYVQLVKESMKIWRNIEKEADVKLLHVTGALDLGPENGPIIQGSLKSCRDNNLDFELLKGKDITKRFGAFTNVPETFCGVYQPEGGYLNPELCIETMVRLAEENGAKVLTGFRVDKIEKNAANVFIIKSVLGEEILAKKVIVSAGAWSSKLLPKLPHLEPERQVLAWYRPIKPAEFQDMPVWVLQDAESNREFYGFPELERGQGIKIGLFNHLYEKIDADTMPRQVTTIDTDSIGQVVRKYMGDSCSQDVTRSTTCIFTNSVDGHFIVDELQENLFVAAGFSGHGFKFASLVGHVLSELVFRLESTSVETFKRMFSANRFKAGVKIKHVHDFKVGKL